MSSGGRESTVFTVSTLAVTTQWMWRRVVFELLDHIKAATESER